MARRTGAWRPTPLTAWSTRGVRASLVVAAVEQHRLPAALLFGLSPLYRVATSFATAQCLSVVRRDATLQRRQRQRPIHKPGIHEGGGFARQLVPDGLCRSPTARRWPPTGPSSSRRDPRSPRLVPGPDQPAVTKSVALSVRQLGVLEARCLSGPILTPGRAGGPAAQPPRRVAAPPAPSPTRTRSQSLGCLASRLHFRAAQPGGRGGGAGPSSSGSHPAAPPAPRPQERSSSTAYSRSIASGDAAGDSPTRRSLVSTITPRNRRPAVRRATGGRRRRPRSHPGGAPRSVCPARPATTKRSRAAPWTATWMASSACPMGHIHGDGIGLGVGRLAEGRLPLTVTRPSGSTSPRRQRPAPPGSLAEALSRHPPARRLGGTFFQPWSTCRQGRGLADDGRQRSSNEVHRKAWPIR